MLIISSVGEFGTKHNPFLEVLTRTYRRPNLLAANEASLEAQTSDNWAQTLFCDRDGIGIGATYDALAAHAPCLQGKYIWILDDDDLCIRPELVEDLIAIDREHSPDVVVMRMDHGPLGILPDADHWLLPPVYGRIGVSAFVVRREVWQTHAPAFRPGQYHSDYRFIASVFDSGPVVYWFDCVASRVQRISNGAAE